MWPRDPPPRLEIESNRLKSIHPLFFPSPQMTTSTATGPPEPSKLFHPVDHRTTTEVSRQEIQAAIAKAMELRTLHAALLQSNSPSHLRLPPPAASPIPRHASHLSAQDYPVFTPSYDDVPRYQSSPSCWDEHSLNGDSRFLSDYKNPNTSSRILLPPAELLTNILPHTCPCPSDDHNSARSRRNSLGDFTSISSRNNCKTENHRYSNLVVPVPMTDTRSTVPSHSKPKPGKSLSWFFPRLTKKKHKNIENSPNRVESSEACIKDSCMMLIEALKKELTEANERRDAALMEVSEMKSSVGDLQEKLEYLENYCEELKKALGQAMVHTKDSDDSRVITRGKPVDLNNENMPVDNEVMVEGFMQMVSEARLSVKHFCRILVAQIDEGDTVLLGKLNLVLQPQKLSLSSKNSKAALCHLEAVINQSLYQDFENCVFQKNGSPGLLDPQQERKARFSSFCALRNLSWNEVLKKGTKYYSEEFSKFCDQKMSGIVTSLNWTQPWPEQLLQTFFVAAKCIWLLHLLAFSFSPAIRILRVEENRSFDGAFMENVFVDRQQGQNPTRVKVMVMPGFYMQDRVIKCKVLCRYKTTG